MITELKIENYKSIQDLTLDVGRVNVLIGENGCGKSNILEAITFAAAAEADKLDNEFLSNRGIRVTEPQLMRSVFTEEPKHKDYIKIDLNFTNVNVYKSYILRNDNAIYSKWTYHQNLHIEKEKINLEDIMKKADTINSEAKKIRHESETLQKRIKDIQKLGFLVKELELEKIKNELINIQERAEIFDNENESIFTKYAKPLKQSLLGDFIIYSPENTSLRNLEKEGQIQPLGINGEGLLKLLTIIQNEANKSQQESIELDDIREVLELFGWYESIEIHNDSSQLEKKITIKDRYLEIPFDQRSANEGFLLVLFYITLVVSKYTPKIFAIDNIDTSLNPKLCTKLIKELTRLAKKYDKQLFVTSHNPAILDGIDLGDDEQRLFVVSRNKQGHTRCKRIELKDKPKSATDEPLKLSEAFLRGYLGGLPKGF